MTNPGWVNVMFQVDLLASSLFIYWIGYWVTILYSLLLLPGLMGHLNSLAPERYWWNIICVIFKAIFLIPGWVISCEIALRWMSLDLTGNKSTLVQVVAWCHQATSHYLSQCWCRSLSSYGVSRPKCVDNKGIGRFLRISSDISQNMYKGLLLVDTFRYHVFHLFKNNQFYIILWLMITLKIYYFSVWHKLGKLPQKWRYLLGFGHDMLDISEMHTGKFLLAVPFFVIIYSMV